LVPKGSIAKGQVLVTTGADKTLPCAICHGPTLKGLGEVPPIAGRQANYVVRQLFSIQDGSRGGISSALMQQVVERLTLDDMLAIAAYTASRQP
jgi:cytochrome c553